MILPVPEHVPTLTELGRVHFVGIGGVAMSGIARAMHDSGVPVTGSETDASSLRGLPEAGIACSIGQHADHVREVDTVVVSTATPADNVEVVSARELGLRVVHRATATASLLLGRQAVAVAGSHGKTSTCGMLLTALAAAGRDVGYLVGGVPVATGASAYVGTDPVFVVEADESDGAFLQLAPTVAIVTNVDPDHLENYDDDPIAYHRAFDEFVANLTADGVLVACADDQGSAALADRSAERGHRVVRYGRGDADVVLADRATTDTGTRIDVHEHGRPLGEVDVAVPGGHFALNAAGAVAVLRELGLTPEQATGGVSAYQGTRRRFQLTGEADGVRVYDDYGHHPTEMRATLETARRVAHGGRVVVLYRPLRFARTMRMGRQLGAALGLADAVVVLDPTGDPLIEGVDGAMVAEHVPLPADRVVHQPDFDRGPADVLAMLEPRAPSEYPGNPGEGPGDLVVTLGAADVARAAPRVLELLTARSSA